GAAAATFRTVIDVHAAAQPRAPFLIAPEPRREIDYAALRAHALSLAAWLAAQAIAPGSTVSFMLPNGVSAATVFLGAMYGGYVVSPINLLAQDAQLEYTLAHSDTRLVFATADECARLEARHQRHAADV